VLDIARYAKLFASLLFSFGMFRLLRLVGMAPWLLDFLEPADQIGLAIVFVAFVLTVVRRAVMDVFGGRG
jgi:hypothetical protein